MAKQFDFTKFDKLEKTEQIEYTTRNFYKMENDMVYRKCNDDFIDHSHFNRNYVKYFPLHVNRFWKYDYSKLHHIIIDTKKGKILPNAINTFAGFKHNNKKMKLTKILQNSVDLFCSFIKEVICNNDDKQYEYILNWIANLCQGNKNSSILYLKSNIQGIGKSTLTEFISEYVIGNKISIKNCDSSPLTTEYNNILSGKLLVAFEELESTSSQQWMSISTKLKRMATSNELIYKEKYMKSYQGRNINNYIINTNCNAVKDSDGRRYFICDLNTKYKNDDKYWNKLYNSCFNNDTGKAFYLMMLDRDISKYNSLIMPVTENKKLSLADRLNPLYKFIKFNYLLKDKPLDDKPKTLHDDFKVYCKMLDIKPVTKHMMTKNLREVGIDYSKTSRKYQIEVKELDLLAKKFKWYSEDDLEELSSNDIYNDELEESISYISTAEHNKVVKNMNSKYEELLKLYNELKH